MTIGILVYDDWESVRENLGILVVMIGSVVQTDGPESTGVQGTEHRVQAFVRRLAVSACWNRSPWRVIVLVVGQPQSGFFSICWR